MATDPIVHPLQSMYNYRNSNVRGAPLPYMSQWPGSIATLYAFHTGLEDHKDVGQSKNNTACYLSE